MVFLYPVSMTFRCCMRAWPFMPCFGLLRVLGFCAKFTVETTLKRTFSFSFVVEEEKG